MEYKNFLFSLFVCLSNPALGTVIDVYTFSAETHQARFIHITKTVRCTFCKNQNLYESLVPSAIDLKHLIATKIKTGDTDDTIYNFLASNYGEIILYTPRFSAHNLLLWMFPCLLLILCCLLVGKNFLPKKTTC